MLRPRRSLLDPSLDKADLSRRQLFAAFHRRHVLRRVLCHESRKQLALGRFPRHHRERAALQFAEQSVLDVEPKFCFALLIVRAMTGETVLRQDGADFAIEVDGWRDLGTSGDGWDKPSEKKAGQREEPASRLVEASGIDRQSHKATRE